MTMTLITSSTAPTATTSDAPIIDKIRAGRRAALASLRAARAEGENVVSFFDGRAPSRQPMPEFHSVRRHNELPVLVLTERIAA